MYTNRRRMPRNVAYIEGAIHIPLRAPVEAFVIDISDHGALIEIAHSDYIPARFTLRLSSFETQCIVCHRDDKRIGVSFAKAYDWSDPGARAFGFFDPDAMVAQRLRA